MIFSIFIFIITLLILVVIHEFGHFIMAKRFGIKVEEFGFGLPPRAWGKKIGETIFSINWLPLGGFVKLLGEDEVDKKILENRRSFAAQIVWKRIAVVVAGVVMNLIFAWLLFYIVLGFSGFKTQLPLLLDHHFLGVNQQVETMVVIAKVAKDSPAEKEGLKSGERILAINDEQIKDDKQLVSKIKNLAGKEIKLTVSDLQKRSFRTVYVTSRENPPQGQGPLGVALSGFRVANLEYQTSAQKILSGPTHSWNLTVYSGKIFGRLIGQSLSQGSLEPVSTSVSGPVGISSLANAVLTSSEDSLMPYLDFVALLSLNLAVINLLPIPALDGGRLFFLLIEAISRKRVHAEVERWVHTAGMALLLALIALITYSDIQKLFKVY